MGNCQAAEAAAVVIQHPGGKVERLYGPATAADVMRGNPGHYVALVVLRVSTARITKVKLLKPKDALLLGQVYRLITSQEVAREIQARRQDKLRPRCEEAVDGRRPGPGHAAGSQPTARGARRNGTDRRETGTTAAAEAGTGSRPSTASPSSRADDRRLRASELARGRAGDATP